MNSPQDRIYRPVQLEDAEDLLALFHQRDMLTYTGVAEGMTDSGVKHYIQYTNQADVWVRAIVDPSSGKFCGIIGLDERGKFCAEDERDLYYWIASEAQGQGVASHAVTEAIARAKEEVGLLALVALVRADNPASVRVLEKNEFEEVNAFVADQDRFGPRHHGKTVKQYRLVVE